MILSFIVVGFAASNAGFAAANLAIGNIGVGSFNVGVAVLCGLVAIIDKRD